MLDLLKKLNFALDSISNFFSLYLMSFSLKTNEKGHKRNKQKRTRKCSFSLFDFLCFNLFLFRA